MRQIKFILPAMALLFLVPLAVSAFERETPVVRAVRTVGPAVVNISAEYTETRHPLGFSDPLFDEFFRDFFEGIPDQKRNSLGSGVIIDGKNGYVLTNAHVVARGETITVTLMDEQELPATLIGSDPETDLAVLQIKTDQHLPEAPLGTSDDLMIGETVIAIGNPFGFSHTVTTGVVSAVDRHVRTAGRVFKRFIQTDASINPGNSGGPLLNINGLLIGINTAIYAEAQGIGFAIPVDRARRVSHDLIRHGAVIPIWVGLAVQDTDPELSGYLGLEGDGALIRDVEAGSPAAKAGIRKGDVLVGMATVSVKGSLDYRERLTALTADKPTDFVLIRNGKKQTRTVTPIPFPMAQAERMVRQRLGITVTDSHRKNGGATIRSAEKTGPLGKIGVQPGDRIRQMENRRIRNATDLFSAMILHRLDDAVAIRIQRGNRTYQITVSFRQ